MKDIWIRNKEWTTFYDSPGGSVTNTKVVVSRLILTSKVNHIWLIKANRPSAAQVAVGAGVGCSEIGKRN